MAKQGKITVHIADYTNVKHYIALMGMENTKEQPQQIGQEVLIPIMFKDLTQVFKLGGNAKIAIPVKPSTVATDKKATKK